VFVQKDGCPDTETRISIKELNGEVTPVTACSRSLSGFSGDNYTFYTPKISPDNKKIAVTLTHSFIFSDLRVAVFDMKGNLLALHKDYAFPAWHSDGYLFMVGPEKNAGIYKTDTTLQNLTRADDGSLSNIISSIDVNASGNQVTFAYNNELWIMDIDQANPRKLFKGGKKQFHGATWSPNGKYIAYFIAESEGLLTNNLEHKLFFYEVSSQKSWSVSTDDVFSNTRFPSRPLTPLSWIQ
jgi:Tol biopolymer transport system component